MAPWQYLPGLAGFITTLVQAAYSVLVHIYLVLNGLGA